MSLLALLCAYVVGLDTDNEAIINIMGRSKLATKTMYEQHLRCTPHIDVDLAMASHDLLRERVRIVQVYDVVSDACSDEMRKTSTQTPFKGVTDLLNEIAIKECCICQSSDPNSSSTFLLFKSLNKGIVLVTSGKNEETIITRDRTSAHAALVASLKTPTGRLLCTRVSRR
jgi:hypothetical protein